ncbi:MAG: hypothetical protein Q9N34_00805 [Aquificota bacterium]|nr:hypothetical protein [Aquificota bacterium]
MTGVDNLNAELMEKRVELFTKYVPQHKEGPRFLQSPV